MLCLNKAWHHRLCTWMQSRGGSTGNKSDRHRILLDIIILYRVRCSLTPNAKPDFRRRSESTKAQPGWKQKNEIALGIESQ